MVDDEHTDVKCSECGSTFCATVMHDYPTGIGGDSQMIYTSPVCPYCWQRSSLAALADEWEQLGRDMVTAAIRLEDEGGRGAGQAVFDCALALRVKIGR